MARVTVRMKRDMVIDGVLYREGQTVELPGTSAAVVLRRGAGLACGGTVTKETLAVFGGAGVRAQLPTQTRVELPPENRVEVPEEDRDDERAEAKSRREARRKARAEKDAAESIAVAAEEPVESTPDEPEREAETEEIEHESHTRD